MKYFAIALLSLSLVTSAAFAQDASLDDIEKMVDQGDLQTAITQLEQRISSNNKDVEAHFMKAGLLLEQGKRLDALAAFQNITRLFPQLPEAHNNLAALYAEDGDYEKARRALLSAAANAPEYHTVQINLGDLYVKMALDAYREALALNPGDANSAAKVRFMEQMFKPSS